MTVEATSSLYFGLLWVRLIQGTTKCSTVQHSAALHHAARSAEQIRHAWNTVATTTNGFQFLLLFQVNLSDLWPAVVTEWWK